MNLTEEQQNRLMGNHDPRTGNCKQAPAVITNVWSETCVNLKVLGDSDADIWITSANLDTATGDIPTPGTWSWPVIVKKES